MGKAGHGFIADNADSGLLEFSPQPPAHGCITGRSLFQSVSGSGARPSANSNPSLRFCHAANWVSIARRSSVGRNTLVSNHLRPHDATRKLCPANRHRCSHPCSETARYLHPADPRRREHMGLPHG